MIKVKLFGKTAQQNVVFAGRFSRDIGNATNVDSYFVQTADVISRCSDMINP